MLIIKILCRLIQVRSIGGFNKFVWLKNLTSIFSDYGYAGAMATSLTINNKKARLDA